MISNQVRNTFIDYFKDQGHSHVSSSSLVPDNDPTLMLLTLEWFNLRMYLPD